ncbi:60S ribosomal protein L18a [Tetrabaena socialis]|uniref:60S ribosomal protein L18a n=1 Tax=Tetrabaena socialis TaxID=47790 RepID=A0A2J7ZY13_9CHLO|nr:60S ribosomal protein L18a [Tetrabaena socialis]|eukprot:PNH05158.1 60S ribosomal protein L18a [Tetrabaena socialis]
MPTQGNFKFHQYQVVGRHLPTATDAVPTVYRMKVWAEDDVKAKSKFWYFLRKLRRVKKANGQIVSCNEVGSHAGGWGLGRRWPDMLGEQHVLVALVPARGRPSGGMRRGGRQQQLLALTTAVLAAAGEAPWPRFRGDAPLRADQWSARSGDASLLAAARAFGSCQRGFSSAT